MTDILGIASPLVPANHARSMGWPIDEPTAESGLVVSAPSASPDHPQGDQSVSGVVSINNIPKVGAKVALISNVMGVAPAVTWTVSGSGGTYEFANIGPGEYAVVAFDPNNTHRARVGHTIVTTTTTPPLQIYIERATSNTSAADDVFYASMPASVNVGDLLVMQYANGSNSTPSTPDGWALRATLANSTLIRETWFTRVSDGTEGGTSVEISQPGGAGRSAIVHRIRAGSYADTGVVLQASGQTGDPHPPSGVSQHENSLWLASAAMRKSGGGTLDSAPETGSPTFVTSGSIMDQASAYAIATGSSRDTGTFGGGASGDAWIASTVVIGLEPSAENMPPAVTTLPAKFEAVGTTQTFVVPAGVTSIRAHLIGPSGGSGMWTADLYRSGAGGYTVVDIPVVPGETLRLRTGKGGKGGSRNPAQGGRGGWPGGGSGAYGDVYAGGGGGYTAIYRSDWTVLAVAGGGAGATGYSASGGNGGGNEGGDGSDVGSGGTQTGPGIGLFSGAQFQGANANNGERLAYTSDDCSGGGAGWWGGSAPSGDGKTAGGGSGYISSGVSGSTHAGVAAGTRPSQIPATIAGFSTAGYGEGVLTVDTSGNFAPDGNDGVVIIEVSP